MTTTEQHIISNEGRFSRFGPFPERLTKIELDVLTLLKVGMTNREIASKLGMTVGTVKWYMNQIFGKLRVRNRIEAFACACNLLALDESGIEWLPPVPTPTPLRKIEYDILSLVEQGLTNREIAGSLALTVGTTRWRINQIFGKLRARNRIEALARARQFEWL
ncbi:MAG TPA: LuxR C-terminal-related transcriptional regulator [Casimicrobiaceae bacterium]|nr:LuxR C-terminal-related transcriptional regulator [Casimicrobiaceae bacterium]